MRRLPVVRGEAQIGVIQRPLGAVRVHYGDVHGLGRRHAEAQADRRAGARLTGDDGCAGRDVDLYRLVVEIGHADVGGIDAVVAHIGAHGLRGDDLADDVAVDVGVVHAGAG